MKRRLVILVFLAMGIKGYECSAASVDPGFHCKDLFPDKNFQKILGENPSEYKIAEKVENAMNINMLSCTFEPVNKNPGGKYSYVSIGVYLPDAGRGPAAHFYANSRRSASYLNKVIDVPGLASNSYCRVPDKDAAQYVGSSFTTLSSNNKYVFDTSYHIVSSNDNLSQKRAREDKITKQILLLVDSKLKSY